MIQNNDIYINKDIIKDIKKFLYKNRIPTISEINFIPGRYEEIFINDNIYDINQGSYYFVLTNKLLNKQKNKIDNFVNNIYWKYKVNLIIRDYSFLINNEILLPYIKLFEY